MKVSCSHNFQPANFALLNWRRVEPNEDGVIFWHLVNYPTSMDKFKSILAFHQAFDTIQYAFDMLEPKGRFIEFRSTDTFDQAHIKIYFLDPKVRETEFLLPNGTKHVVLNEWPFSGPGEVLAHRIPNAFELHFDQSEPWAEMHKPNKINLKGVAIHETLHVLDLGHSSVKGSIMEPYYDPTKISLHSDDMLGLQHVWGPVKRKLAGTDENPIIEAKGCLFKLLMLGS